MVSINFFLFSFSMALALIPGGGPYPKFLTVKVVAEREVIKATQGWEWPDDGHCSPLELRTNKLVVVSDGQSLARATLMQDSRDRLQVITFNCHSFSFKGVAKVRSQKKL